MKKIILFILLGSSVISNVVFGSRDIDSDHQDSPHGQSSSSKRKRNDNSSSRDRKRLKSFQEYEITERDRKSNTDAKIRSQLTHTISIQGFSLPCSEDKEVYLQLLSQDQTLMDKDFHELFMNECRMLNPSVLNEIQECFYDKNIFLDELNNAENKQDSRTIISFGLWYYFYNKDFHVPLCSAALEHGHLYFFKYAINNFNRMLNYSSLLKVVEHSETSSDIHYFSDALSRLTFNLFDESHDDDFSNLLNEVAKKRLVNFSEELIRRYPRFKKRTPRKKLREQALSTALENEDLGLIEKLVPNDERNMLELEKSPLQRAIEINSINAMKYFLSFQKKPQRTSSPLLNTLFNQEDTNTIKLFCDHDCVQNILPEVLEEAISTQNLEIVKYLVEEKNVQITDQHLQSCERHNHEIIQWKTLDIPHYLLDRSDAEVKPDFIGMLLKQKDIEEQKELFTKIANRIEIVLSSPYKAEKLFKVLVHLQSKQTLFESLLSGIDDIPSFLEKVDQSYGYISPLKSNDEKIKYKLNYNNIVNNIKNFSERDKNIKG